MASAGYSICTNVSRMRRHSWVASSIQHRTLHSLAVGIGLRFELRLLALLLGVLRLRTVNARVTGPSYWSDVYRRSERQS
ncbi:hypothetical protein DFH11DRAFT_1609112 [Phellopilus nigrolimitatus]|nr:hypothetical protein DFH11DRAFT_1609112 [Phellopilus nigrolimitatus]